MVGGILSRALKGGGQGGASGGGAADFPAGKSEAAWKAELAPEQFHVLRQHGTERPFSHPLKNEKRAGTFHCAGCGAALFDSGTKYDSGSGWRRIGSAVTPRTSPSSGLHQSGS